MCSADGVTSEGGPQAASNTNDGTAEGVSEAAGSTDEVTADCDSKVAGSIDKDATEGVSKTAEPADEGAPEEAAPCQFTQSAIVNCPGGRPQVRTTIRQVSKSLGDEGAPVTAIFEPGSSSSAVTTMSGIAVTG